MEIELRLSPSEQDIAVIYEGLKEFNREVFPDLHEQSLGIFVKNTAGEILGGLIAKHLYTSIYINYLWLAEPARHQGFGASLMAKLESYGREQGAERLFVDTYNFQAPGFYKSLGFSEVGRYVDSPKAGIDKIFYCKTITPSEKTS